MSIITYLIFYKQKFDLFDIRLEQTDFRLDVYTYVNKLIYGFLKIGDCA